ncbi:MAG: hypothetical protein KDA87_08740, partial [Planctomycetales bacterium]|nr:hypothetical protein [Planctomycetales bacterium]
MMYSQQPTAAARLFFIVATAIILTGLYLGKDVILPVALAVLISFMLTPAVRGLELRSCPRAVAVL